MKEINALKKKIQMLKSQHKKAFIVGGPIFLLGFMLLLGENLSGGFIIMMAGVAIFAYIYDFESDVEVKKIEYQIGTLVQRESEAAQRESEALTRSKEISSAYELKQKGGLDNLKKALEIYVSLGYLPTSKQIRNIKIAIAKEKEVNLDYTGAIAAFEKVGLHKDAKRIRQKMREEGKVKVDQTVVHGDYVDDRDTIVKDSVINRSNVGAGGDDKFTKLKELTEMKKEGLISDEEYEKMKQEIIG